MLYRAVCRNCGFILTEGAGKETQISIAKGKSCKNCNAVKWKIIEAKQESEIIDSTEDSKNDNSPGQSSLTDY